MAAARRADAPPRKSSPRPRHRDEQAQIVEPPVPSGICSPAERMMSNFDWLVHRRRAATLRPHVGVRSRPTHARGDQSAPRAVHPRRGIVSCCGSAYRASFSVATTWPAAPRSPRSSTARPGSCPRSRLGVGVGAIWLVSNFEKAPLAGALLAAFAFLGGVMRIVSMVVVGMPDFFAKVATGLEMALPLLTAVAADATREPLSPSAVAAEPHARPATPPPRRVPPRSCPPARGTPSRGASAPTTVRGPDPRRSSPAPWRG